MIMAIVPVTKTQYLCKVATGPLRGTVTATTRSLAKTRGEQLLRVYKRRLASYEAERKVIEKQFYDDGFGYNLEDWHLREKHNIPQSDSTKAAKKEEERWTAELGGNADHELF